MNNFDVQILTLKDPVQLFFLWKISYISIFDVWYIFCEGWGAIKRHTQIKSFYCSFRKTKTNNTQPGPFFCYKSLKFVKKRQKSPILAFIAVIPQELGSICMHLLITCETTFTGVYPPRTIRKVWVLDLNLPNLLYRRHFLRWPPQIWLFSISWPRT